MKRKILASLLSIVMILSLAPTIAFAADAAVSTEADLISAISNASGTKEAPTVITVSGNISLSAPLVIGENKHVKLVGAVEMFFHANA